MGLAADSRATVLVAVAAAFLGFFVGRRPSAAVRGPKGRHPSARSKSCDVPSRLDDDSVAAALADVQRALGHSQARVLGRWQGTPGKRDSSAADDAAALAANAATAANDNKPIVVGVAGGTGSGKSTMADALISTLGRARVAVLTHDAYYKDLAHLSIEERAVHNFDHPDSLDTALLVEHVRALKRGEAVEAPTYSFVTHTRTAETETIEPKQVRADRTRNRTRRENAASPGMIIFCTCYTI